MFKRVVTHKGFWKSVFFIGLLYLAVFLLVQFIAYPVALVLLKIQTFTFIVVLVFASLIAAFGSAYAKFWAKLKEQDYRDKR